MLSRLVVMLMLTCFAVPASAGMRDTPLCKSGLAVVSANLGESSARAQRAGSAKCNEACVAYRSYFLEVVKARSMAAQCKTGPERDQELGKLDVSAEQANDGIAARCSRKCGSIDTCVPDTQHHKVAAALLYRCA